MLVSEPDNLPGIPLGDDGLPLPPPLQPRAEERSGKPSPPAKTIADVTGNSQAAKAAARKKREVKNSTGVPQGRRHGKKATNTKVAESKVVDKSDKGELTTKTEEYVRDPLVDEMLLPASSPGTGEMVEVTGADNDMLIYLEWESGATIDEISGKWRIKPVVAKKMIDAAHARMVEEFESGDCRAVRAMQDQSLRRIRGVALREFAKSQGERKRVVTKKGIVGDKETDIVEVMKEDSQPGDPRFLSVAITAEQHIAKIWGVEAPKRVRHEGSVALLGVDVSQMDESALLELANVYHAAKRIEAKVAEANVVESSANRVS